MPPRKKSGRRDVPCIRSARMRRTSASEISTVAGLPPTTALSPISATIRRSCSSCHSWAASTSKSCSMASDSASHHAVAVRGRLMSSAIDASRATRSASRPARAMSSPSTPSGAIPLGAKSKSSSLTATPMSNRSIAACHELASNSGGKPHGWRWGPSRPQRTLVASSQSTIVPRASLSNSKRRRTAGNETNSITSEAANLPETSASNESSAAMTGYDSRSDRSVMR